MEKAVDVRLKSINGLTPEQYMKVQAATEDRVRKKNQKEHSCYLLFVGVIALVASTSFQYLLATIIAVCGWIWLWYSQNIPLGPDNGMPRTRGLPPIFGFLLLLFPITTLGAACVFIYTFLASL